MDRSQDFEILILSIINYFYVLFINFLITYVDDRRLSRYYTNVKGEDSYLDDFKDDDVLTNNFILNDQNKRILQLCNIKKTLLRYNKKNIPNTYEKLVIKSFLFNFHKGIVMDNHQFTNKLIMINNVYDSMNVRVIRNLTSYKYKYIYIFYRLETGEYKVKIVDMVINYDITNNSSVLFGSIRLS